jgi:hypothetical protein
MKWTAARIFFHGHTPISQVHGHRMTMDETEEIRPLFSWSQNMTTEGSLISGVIPMTIDILNNNLQL